VISEECAGKDWSKVPWWLWSAEDSGQLLVFGGLLFAWLEMHRRGHETEQRLLATQQERARLRRSAFDARLTAMRARIDPQFLFDSLADVQSTYAIDKAQGAATLDLLIAYLRTALPRLRAEGSTVGAEAELVEAWLAVVAARRNGHPARQIEVWPDCLNAPFPATVLLPLVQWAAGDGSQPGCNQVLLQGRRVRQNGAPRLHVELRVAPGRSNCDEDPELRRIRERLWAMYGEAASLTCAREALHDDRAGSGSAIVVTLLWPDEGPDSSRC
jgi:LytS/YehU family sensor histidine kinase